IRLHVLDSLSAVGPVRARLGDVRSVVDIGSGGGYPGIPLGLALGAGTIGLVDSVGRKARFLEVAGAAARAAVADERALEVEVLPVRAEELASGERRATWDVATVRAVGSVAECAELGLPLLRPGGLLVCWKRDSPVAQHEVGSEVAAARPLVHRLGGGVPDVVDAGVPGAPGHRLVLVRKERPTPGSYPRPPALRRSDPSRPARHVAGATRRS
ncbi:MAG: RsmG family class I SAM-dependent methyltransferase, partial [Candidatus Limnocylindrales bacterium]